MDEAQGKSSGNPAKYTCLINTCEIYIVQIWTLQFEHYMEAEQKLNTNSSQTPTPLLHIMLLSQWVKVVLLPHLNPSFWPCSSSLWVTHLLSRATLLPRTQLSCSWTHSAVLCKSAARPAEGGGLGLLWLASELRLRDVIDGCCLCGGGAGGTGGGPCWLDRWSPGEKQRDRNIQTSLCV